MNTPLVSIAVVTYNSSKTVIETLESIFNQSYQNIELVISDDCSMDDTVEICHEWVEEHKERFARTQIIYVSKNTGIPANMNRAVKACNGEWIKSIAGDDILEQNAIDEFVKFIIKNKCQMCVCDLLLFSTEGDVDPQLLNLYKTFFEKAKEDLNAQKKRILLELYFCGPGYFYSKALYDLVGGFDEKYLGEEWPFCIKVIYSGNRIYALDKKLVRYRVSSSSLSRQKPRENEPPVFFYHVRRNFFEYRFSRLLGQGMFREACYMFVDFQKQNALYRYKFKGKITRYLLSKSIYSFIDVRYYKRKFQKIHRLLSHKL